MTLPKSCEAFSAPFQFFTEFAAIPHGSGNCRAIADYLCAFAKARGLSYERDGADNVLIRKGATAGYENRPAVILQGHTDMVAVKRDGVAKDMQKEGLDLKIEGDFLFAEGTSLGGDDGVAVAYLLAILDSDTLPHPPIEALFTTDEEIGLLGATAFDCGKLTGKTLFNLDSEEEGIFTVGCAGGVRCDAVLPVSREAKKSPAFRVTLSGLTGGHSGVEIDKGRANALVALAEMIAKNADFRLVSFDGGDADNAIPSSARAVILSDENPTAYFQNERDLLAAAFAGVELGIKIEVTPTELPYLPMDAASSAKVLSFVANAPHGVRAMSADIAGLVQSSENPGMARTGETSFSLTTSVRSSVSAEKEALVQELKDLAKGVGGAFSTRGDYPAWEYKKVSPLRDVMCAVYEKTYGKAPECVVIHAGLECGIFAKKIPDMDGVATGPNLYDIHSPDERLSLSSAARTYEFITEVLKAL